MYVSTQEKEKEIKTFVAKGERRLFKECGRRI
jgi:hypothetical protein